MVTVTAHRTDWYTLWCDALRTRIAEVGGAIPKEARGVLQFSTLDGAQLVEVHVQGAASHMLAPRFHEASRTPDARIWVDPIKIRELLVAGNAVEGTFTVRGDEQLYRSFFSALEQDTRMSWLEFRCQR